MSDYEDDFGVDFEDLDFDASDFENAEFENADFEEYHTLAHDSSENHLQLDEDLLNLQTLSPSQKREEKTDESDTWGYSPGGAGARKITKQKAYTEEELEELQYRRQKFQNGRQLMEIVKLEGVSFDIFNLPPRSEFEMYITSMGGKFKQTSVQAPIPEERMNQSMNTMRSTLKPSVFQLKERKNCTISVQAPDDIGLFSEVTRHLHTVNRYRDDDEDGAPSSSTQPTQLNSLSMAQFLEKVLPTVEEILEDNRSLKLESSGDTQGKNISVGSSTGKHRSSYSFSSSYITLFNSSITSDRNIVDVLFHPTNRNQVFVCYSPLINEDSVSSVKDPGLVCLWNVNQPKEPLKILVSESEISHIVVIPDRPHYVVGTTRNGSVELWNLKESEGAHPQIQIQGERGVENVCKRSPTYSTDWLIDENHKFPVVGLKVLGYNAPPSNDSASNATSSHIASLDRNGNVIFWIIVELQDNSVSESDYGLSVGGSVKLVRGGEFNVLQGKAFSTSSSGLAFGREMLGIDDDDDHLFNESFSSFNLQGGNQSVTSNNPGLFLCEETTYGFDCEPQNPTQFVVASDRGTVKRCGRFVNHLSPSSYFCDGVLPLDGTSHVSTLIYSRLSPNFFLASQSNGSVHLFATNRNTPLFTISSLTDQEIIQLTWHPALPSVCFALDSKSSLFIIDFLGEKGHSLLFQGSISRAQQSSRSESLRASKFQLSQADSRGASNLAIGYTGGYVDVHELSPEFSSLPVKEMLLKNFV